MNTKITDYPCFCISLKRAKDRRKQFKYDWGNELKYEIFDAVDKNDLQSNGKIQVPELACLKSHRQVLIQNLEQIENAGGVIILEDDVEPLTVRRDDWNKSIESCTRQNGHTLLLHEHTDPVCCPQNTATIKPEERAHPLNNNNIPFWGTCGIWRNVQGVYQYLERTKHLETVADNWKHYFRNHGGVFVAVPALVYHYADQSYIATSSKGRDVLP